MPRILVAGATGRLGMRLVRRLHADGFSVRILARDAARIGLIARHADDVVQADLTAERMPAGICDDVDVVFSCAGASTSLFDIDNAASFERVNHLGNTRLLEAARMAGVGRFIYVAPLGAERLTHTAYGVAHERFVATLRASDMRHTIIRPTGYFSFFGEALRLLHGGVPWTHGDGPWRTNPIHESDLAEFCMLAMMFSGDEEIAVGGPETFTRADILQLARRTLAAGALPGFGDYCRPLRTRENERLAQLLQFGSAVCRIHVVGTAYGSQRLGDYFAAMAASWRPRSHAA